MSKNTCFYCKKLFMLYDLRPYGPDNSMICHQCGNDPKYIDLVQANIERAFDKAKAEARRRTAEGEKIAIRIHETRGYIVVPASDVGPDDMRSVIDISDRAKS